MSPRIRLVSAAALALTLGIGVATTTATASTPDEESTPPLDSYSSDDTEPSIEEAITRLDSEFVFDELSKTERALLEREWAVTEQAGKEALQIAIGLESFGGGVVVGGENPRVDFLFTDDADAAAFGKLMGVNTEVATRVVDFTEEDLASQARELSSAWRDANPEETVVSSEIDLERQVIYLGVREELVSEAELIVGQSRSASQAPVIVHATEIPTPAGCSNNSPREYCTDPMMTGSMIRSQSTSGPRCTMGFHVIASNGDRRFLTAGHCDYAGPGTFYHKGFGPWPVGSREGEWLTTCPWSYCYGRDVQMTGLPDTQASDEILGYNYSDVDWARNPFHNELVCLSGAASNDVRCGRVTSTAATWYESISRFNVEGMKAAIQANKGDSGGPMVAGGTAIGLLSNTGGYFTEMGDVLNHWNLDWVD